MNNNNNGQGGKQYNPHMSGGRPRSDANYGPKKKNDRKPQNAGRGDRGNRGGGARGDRGNRSGGGSRGGGRPQTEMFTSVCATCKKSCEVPFRPDGSKPVLCSECFGKSKSDTRGGFDRNSRPRRDFDTPRQPSAPSLDCKALLTQVANLEGKVAEILEILKTTQKEEVAVENEVVTAAPKKTASKKVATKKVVKKTETAKVIKKPMVKKAIAKSVVKKAAPKKVVAKKLAVKKATKK